MAEQRRGPAPVPAAATAQALSATGPTGSAGHGPAAELSHREILTVMAGLLSALGTAMLAATVVANALPAIAVDLGASATETTLIFIASLFMMTVTTPIWGKLSDQLDKKTMMQVALIVLVAASIANGLAVSTWMLICCRMIQGVGMGGVTVLTQTILATVIPPRTRGRYNGYYGAVTSTATVSGPLLGGLIVDAPGMGWRWVFFLCVPFAVVSLVMLQKFLRLDHRPTPVKFDYLGALAITATVSLLMVWLTFGGAAFAWWSAPSAAIGASIALLIPLAVRTQLRARQPLVPLHMATDRTVVLAVAASMVIGMAVFGASVFLAQYFQFARGLSASAAGILVAPMMLGSLAGSVVSGQLITRYGRWKRFLVTGGVLLVTGLSAVALAGAGAPLWAVCLAEAAIGLGMGMSIQNLVLVAQNTVDLPQVGTVGALVTFMRNLGGTIGVTGLGAVLAASLGGKDPADVDPARYATALSTTFLVAAGIAVVSLTAVLALRETPLRTTVAKTDDGH